MGKAKIILTLLFVLTLSSGLVAGMLVSRLPAVASTTTTTVSPKTPFAEALQLTDAQNEQMRKIWEGVRDNVDQCFRDAQNVQKQRDEAMVAMLTPEQKAKFATIQRDAATSLARLKSERDAMFQQAVAETKKMLTPSQQKRYDEILQTRLGRGPGGSAPDWLAPQGATSVPGDVR